jgi:lipid-A-disaccharide synthase
MGIFEVLPRLPLILRRIRQTASDIEAWQPDVLVTVDSWGFVSALLTKLRKKNQKRRPASGVNTGAPWSLPPVVHYVAPQVWAWKKGRAKNVARLVDRLMTLLPDEGRYFEKYGLRCDFVGHPVVERIAEAGLDPAGFRAANAIPADVRVISVLPGSRHSEVKRLLPILQDSVRQMVAGEARVDEPASDFGAASGRKDLFVVVPTVAGVEDEVRREFEDFELPVRVVTGEVNRYNAFAVSTIALAKSGTVSLELAAVGVPHLIMYKFNALSNLAAKLLVKIRFANLINLMADREIIPEFVLDNCRADLIAPCARKLLDSPEVAAEQVVNARKVMQRLRLPDILPSDRAAQVIIEEVDAK